MKIRNSMLVYIWLIVLVPFLGAKNHAKNSKNNAEDEIEMDTMQSPLVYKYTLKNGLTILVRPTHTIPKVSMQLFYNVGSKNEGTGERGIAHFIEHLIFKGTTGKKSLHLSESDINVIAQKLAAYTNAFTSYDYTGYVFDIPTSNWKQVLPIMADCMQHCSFKDDHINSEMKAVIQELKMYKDSYTRDLLLSLVGTIFDDHPYHHPVIGYKQDLWSIDSAGLKKFYQKHYIPNNATLVMVGAVDPEEVLKEVEKVFGHISVDNSYEKSMYYHREDVARKSLTLYRDIQQPEVVLVYTIPGEEHKKSHIIDLVHTLLFNAKSARLYKKLVDELELVTSLSSGDFSMFEHGIFYIHFKPKDMAQVDAIIDIINEEFASIAADGVRDGELNSAVKQVRMDFYQLLENIHSQAYNIGKSFLASGDENYIMNYLQEDMPELQKGVQEIVQQYLRSTVAHRGMVLPLPESERDAWQKIQQESDTEDNHILSARTRTSPVEAPSYAKKMQVNPPIDFDYPKPQVAALNNGATLLHYHNDATPKIDMTISFKARGYYDPEDKQGLYACMMRMLKEGTSTYTAAELAHELESRGIVFAASPGAIIMSMVKEDLEKGLEILVDILNNATFEAKALEKIRTQMKARLQSFWDEPRSFTSQLVKEHIYKGHPYAKNLLGTENSLNAITPEDLKKIYKEFLTPQEATIAIVGDIASYDVVDVCNKAFEKWQGKKLADISFPEIQVSDIAEYNYPINRDQVVLAFSAPSINRFDPNYDACILFDQIFSGRSLLSLYSRLMQLREQSGLFYTIGGSTISGADEQPGMIYVSTIVSLDRLQEAEDLIKKTIDTVVDSITQEELDEARNAIVNSLISYFESNGAIAEAFLFLKRFNLPDDYFDRRNEKLKAITLEDMKRFVHTILSRAPLTVFRVGRVER